MLEVLAVSARIRRRCTGSPTCPNPAGPGGKCDTHASLSEAQRNARRAVSRSIYLSKRWKKLRRRKLLDDPYCEEPDCRAVATDVDHVERIELRPDLAYEITNLRSLCHPHHSSKTARETGFGGAHE